MKRCPHCEFIYEDDQSYCDMDGTKLAHDSRSLPKLQALSATSEPDSRWRSRAVPVFASAMLVIVLGLVYYVSTRQIAPTVSAGADSTTIEPVNIPTAPSPVPSVPEATSVATDSATQTEVDSKTSYRDAGAEARKPADPRTNKVNVGRSSKVPQQVRNQKDPGVKEPAEKDDSKVRSILKKTGRFFKKTLPL